MRDEAALRRHAILCVLASSGLFVFAGALVKAVSTGIPTVQVMLFRSVFAGLVVAPLLWREGGLSALRTRRPWDHVLRTTLGCGGMVCAFYGVARLPLAINTALGFAMPLLLTLLSIPLLGERVGWKRIAVVLAGLAGVLIVVRPWQETGLAPVAVAVVLLGVVFWALTMIAIRRMGEKGERNVTIVVWFAIGGATVSALLTVPVWVPLQGWQWAALVGVGLISGVAQMLMTEGYRSGQASLVAPFEYGAIVYATAMGVFLWGEWPDAASVLGIGVIVAAGLYLWWDSNA